jgi:hypothetical protein
MRALDEIERLCKSNVSFDKINEQLFAKKVHTNLSAKTLGEQIRVICAPKCDPNDPNSVGAMTEGTLVSVKPLKVSISLCHFMTTGSLLSTNALVNQVRFHWRVDARAPVSVEGIYDSQDEDFEGFQDLRGRILSTARVSRCIVSVSMSC